MTAYAKPRVERAVHYVQQNFFAGESFKDLAHCRALAETWCRVTAGTRIHGTTQLRPGEVFRAEELPRLLPAPGASFDPPVFSEPKVHPDRHVEVDRALYSVPGHLVGRRLRARRDAATVKLYFRGELVKVHPRMAPGKRSSDPADFPTGTALYATRDTQALKQLAASNGPHVARVAEAILDTPLPWTKMRQVYRLIGLAKKWGPQRLDDACQRALDAESTDVNLIARMLERGRESLEVPVRFAPVVAARFAREPSDFSSKRAAP
ncbi:MAG: Mu transposase domain-containing protein [Acidimicrobiales bacterium]